MHIIVKRGEVTGEWRRLHDEELHAVYYASNIIRVIKSRIMSWAGNVAGMGKRRGTYRALMGKPEGKDHLQNLVVDGRTVMKWIFKKWDGESWTGLISLRIEAGRWLL